MRARRFALFVAMTGLLSTSCGDTEPPAGDGSLGDPSIPTLTTATTSNDTATSAVDGTSDPWPVAPSTLDHADPARWTIEIVRVIPHDPAAFTQGLEILDGVLYESTGRYGESTLRAVDPGDGEVLRTIAIDEALFAEGITIFDDTLIQLTWKAGTALRWSLPDLTPLDPFHYEGEGWGVCRDGDSLITSDGTATLTRRAADDFSVVATVTVTLQPGGEVTLLNELECMDGLVLANVWKWDSIVLIDPADGSVLAIVDASPLAEVIDRPHDDQAVLNGIADLGDGTLLLGGKLWPHQAVVRLVTS